ncbi:suppressor APC domain-containing protein 1 [Scleropages formosus]|uniref:suppressor APC domain-containing protein 1 n=1 Tax=Scleropages formosus TaxID=113540 RepID=UPI0008787D81|nr:suppressor APC domain-containing protein 1 [Scleropages formosus]
MACPGSYTVVLIPLQNSLQSLDAVRFFLWLRRLKQLEQEKDCLWTGLQVLEQVRSWYRQRLEENRQLQGGAGPRSGQLGRPSRDCLIRSCIQRVNSTLGKLMCDPIVLGVPSPDEGGASDSGLRWQNTVLIKEVSEKSRRISVLEQERDWLLRKLSELQTS